MDSEWIQSRKIAYGSMSRHFAGWKTRQFVLNSNNATLEIYTPENAKVTRIELSSPGIIVGRHDYAPEASPWLWIRYFDKEEGCPKEIVMKFDDKEVFENWERKLSHMVDVFRAELASDSMSYVGALASFLKEQAHCQTLLEQEDNEETSAAYFHDKLDMDEMDEMDEMEALEDEQDEWNDCDAFQRSEDESVSFADLVPRDNGAPLSLNNKTSKPLVDAYPKHTLRSLAVPRMNILIMAVGTRGDIQPFTQLGLRLQKDGHRVRLATHAMFREYIVDKNLEFYPLAGDPVVLSEFMVKTQGFIIPTTAELLLEAPKQHAMVVDIINSCWGACIEPDPQDAAQRTFAADAIISNPVTYAHVHCAEALGVPLHLMFPQPWTPTKAFPHPLSCLSYQRPWCIENYMSYQFVDRTMWLSFEKEINKFRVSVLGLEPIRTGDGGWNILNEQRVPFVKMWSPTLVPKPKDWGEHIDVVGAFLDPVQIVNSQLHAAPPVAPTSHSLLRSYDPLVRRVKSEDSLLPVPSNAHYEPAPELAAFLDQRESTLPIVFVGFGSMVVDDLPRILSLFLDAAALANVKILVQIGWSAVSPETFLQLALNAQAQAALVRETERANFLGESLIFPSTTSAAAPCCVGRESSVWNDAECIVEEEENESDERESEKESEKERESVSSSSLGQWFASIGSSLGLSQRSQHHTDKSSKKSEKTKARARDREEEDLSSWDEVEHDGWTAAKHAFFMGPCPHNWLFQKVHAVVHHGGAGTTAAGLRFGCPTWVCPFFGDQFFWGEMVHRAGLGPKPCPIGLLSVPLVVDALQSLKGAALRENALRMSERAAREDGVEGAVRAFYRHLPLEQMLCEVSLFRGECVLAQEFCVDCGLKMSAEASREIHGDAARHAQDHVTVSCVYRDWRGAAPAGAAQGVVQGVGGFLHETVEGVAAALRDPPRGLGALVQHQLCAGALLYDKLREGVRRGAAARRAERERARERERQGGAAAGEGATLSLSPHTHTRSSAPSQITNSERCKKIRAQRVELRAAQLRAERERALPRVRLGPSSASLCSSLSLSSSLSIAAQDALQGLRAPGVLSPIAEEDAALCLSPAVLTTEREGEREGEGLAAVSLSQATMDISQKERGRDIPNSALLAELTQSMLFPAARSEDAQDEMERETERETEREGETELLVFASLSESEKETERESDEDEQAMVHSEIVSDALESSRLSDSHRAASEEVSVAEALAAAKEVMQLFRAAGATDGRTLSEQQFVRLMQKSIAREHALHDESDELVEDRHQNALVRSALRILSRNKSDIDFVNFAMFCQDYGLR